MYLFEQDIRIEQINENEFKANISSNWSINGNPDGGYLMALAAKAMMNRTKKKATPLITANFISRCVPGDIFLRVESIQESTQFSRMSASIFQDGSEKVRALGTYAAQKVVCDVERYESGPPEIEPAETCIAIPGFENYTMFQNMDVRLDPGCAGWMEGRLTEKSEFNGWISFKDGRPVDLYSILLMADSFPPAVFASQGMVAWVPTLEMSVSIRNVPENGKRLMCRFNTNFINCGLIEEDGEIWDENGGLVAISRQIAQYRRL